MRLNDTSLPYPSWTRRVLSVWFRHYRVYIKNLISNGFPPFLEPLIFLAGIGLGIGKYIGTMDGVPYIEYLATGLPLTAAMFTAAFECSFGTFIRLEFDKVYDGMLAAPLTVNNLVVGEILWAGSKGLFFSCAVVIVVSAFGLVPMPESLWIPVCGFLTGIMFAAISLFVTSFVKTINHFSFYFTGFLSPMFFFSGVVFPIADLPAVLRPAAEFFPLTHCVRLARAVPMGRYSPSLLLDLVWIVGLTGVIGYVAARRLTRRLIT